MAAWAPRRRTLCYVVSKIVQTGGERERERERERGREGYMS